MEILDQLLEIDKNTGDVDTCLSFLKGYKKSYLDLYKKYKQYWVLVYVCDQEIDSFIEFEAISEEKRLNIISKQSPKNLNLFSLPVLKTLLSLSDAEVLPLIPII